MQRSCRPQVLVCAEVQKFFALQSKSPRGPTMQAARLAPVRKAAADLRPPDRPADSLLPALAFMDASSPRLHPQGLAEWMRRRALRAPEKPALSFQGSTWSYGELQARIERMAAMLAGGGVGPGDRVAWLAFNHPDMLVTLFATARIGAILVPLNYRLSAVELRDIVLDAGARTLIVDERNRAAIEPVRAAMGCTRHLLFGGDAAGWESLQAALQRAPASVAAVSGEPDDVAMLMYTSGTTGRPKGVMLSHRNFWDNNINWLLTSDYTSRDVALNMAPLFHVGGLCVVLLVTFMSGGHNVLHEGFDPATFLADIQRYQVTVTFTVPAMMLFATQHPSFAATDLSSLRMIVAGGAPVPEPLLQTYAARGVPVSQCYGMTEATAGVTFLETGRASTKLGSCGRPGMLTEVKLIDEQGREITEPDVPGELCMRGGNVTQGYWNMPEATAQVLGADGWFRSGDVARRDAEGFYTICDRTKDMIISGGENIYSAEVESVLYGHPAIAEAAVIGIPDPKWGETVLAIVALKPGQTLTLEALRDFAAQRLARFKLPRALEIVEQMPRNSNGKVMKPDLRQRFAQRPRQDN
jgi:fatty-acyl-CoA synthase